MSEGINEAKPESNPVDLEQVKEELGKYNRNSLPNEISGLEIKELYDSGSEPETGTSRTDTIVVKLTGKGGSVHHALLSYYFRSPDPFYNVSFVSEQEAKEFIDQRGEN